MSHKAILRHFPHLYNGLGWKTSDQKVAKTLHHVALSNKLTLVCPHTARPTPMARAQHVPGRHKSIRPITETSNWIDLPSIHTHRISASTIMQPEHEQSALIFRLVAPPNTLHGTSFHRIINDADELASSDARDASQLPWKSARMVSNLTPSRTLWEYHLPLQFGLNSHPSTCKSTRTQKPIRSVGMRVRGAIDIQNRKDA